ncbi:RepB family plasmid replication initiator protein [Larsenimonas salina]|uniref:RepB family plasmid replication initiator protein n=1 Tax=Larsenimonas salina TaxID=1295565 RepID=UPI002073C341|nr:RepB family plasmid replication initiator protein [Larsenimonas salina]MCM5705843.1 replication initiation protein [Larsenimonas salina]
MDPSLIYKSNALIEASYRLSVYEQRIVLACITQVRRDQPLTDQQLYEVSAQQIADMTGTQLGTAYQNLKAASERLFERRVTLHEAPNSKSGGKVRLTRWVQTVEYREAEGMVALRFGTDMIPYLSQLTEQFTRYALADVARMDSAYAIRLYELLCQWRDAGQREVSIEWLREAFQLEGKYPAIKDFKRWVVQPAVDQINEHSPLWVKWEQRKTGRRVSHLVFSFGEKAPEKPQKQRKNKTKGKAGSDPQTSSGALYGIPTSTIKAQAQPGESYEDAALRILENRRSASKS